MDGTATGVAEVDRAIRGVERAVDKLIPLLAAGDPERSQRAALALLNLGATAGGRLGVAVFRAKGDLRLRIIRLLGGIATFEGASVLPALRKLLGEDLDPMTCAEVRGAFLVALKQVAEAQQAATPAGPADG